MECPVRIGQVSCKCRCPTRIRHEHNTHFEVPVLYRPYLSPFKEDFPNLGEFKEGCPGLLQSRIWRMPTSIMVSRLLSIVSLFKKFGINLERFDWLIADNKTWSDYHVLA